MHPIASRITRILEADTLTESAAGDLAVKTLKEHDMAPAGVNPMKIAKGIAKRHGVPMTLVPQIIHGAAVTRDSMLYDMHLRSLGGGTPRYAFHQHDTWEGAISAYKEQWKQRLGQYADGSAQHLDVDYSRDPVAIMERATDRARQWHELGTHPAKHRILDDAVLERHASSRGEETLDHDAHDDLARDWAEETMDAVTNRHRDAAKAGGSYVPANTRHLARSREAYDDVHDRLADYNPLQKATWEPHTVPSATDHVQHFWDNHVREVGKQLAGRRGMHIPFKPDAEHAHEGVTYRGYTLDTPEKANAGCWGDRWCVAHGDSGSKMNEHYHGGTYKPAHIITKVAKLPEGGVRETPYAAYLPELLPGQQHEDWRQAVRNSGNNGHVEGAAFTKIRPLLSKLDKRIDAPGVAHVYAHGDYSMEDM